MSIENGTPGSEYEIKPDYSMDRTAILELVIDPKSIDLTLNEIDHEAAEAELAKAHITGVDVVGQYDAVTADGQELVLPIVTFLYHKENKDGEPELKRRIVIVTGHGFGTHPGHAGQEEADYLVGVQLGVEGDHGQIEYDPSILVEVEGDKGQIEYEIEDGKTVLAKSFSVDCIWGGSKGYNPVLANG